MQQNIDMRALKPDDKTVKKNFTRKNKNVALIVISHTDRFFH